MGPNLPSTVRCPYLRGCLRIETNWLVSIGTVGSVPLFNSGVTVNLYLSLSLSLLPLHILSPSSLLPPTRL